MVKSTLLQVQLSLKGRPLRSFKFKEKMILIGRDPEATLFLDNLGISRRHSRIERTDEGYVLEDLASANGTFLNDNPITRAVLDEGDVVRIGKFSLWISMIRDPRRESFERPRVVPPEAYAGTTVLQSDQIEHMLESAQESEPVRPQFDLVESKVEVARLLPKVKPAPRFSGKLWLAVTLGVGILLGSIVTWALMTFVF